MGRFMHAGNSSGPCHVYILSRAAWVVYVSCCFFEFVRDVGCAGRPVVCVFFVARSGGVHVAVRRRGGLCPCFQRSWRPFVVVVFIVSVVFYGFFRCVFACICPWGRRACVFIDRILWRPCVVHSSFPLVGVVLIFLFHLHSSIPRPRGSHCRYRFCPRGGVVVFSSLSSAGVCVLWCRVCVSWSIGVAVCVSCLVGVGRCFVHLCIAFADPCVCVCVCPIHRRFHCLCASVQLMLLGWFWVPRIGVSAPLPFVVGQSVLHTCIVAQNQILVRG